MVKLEQIQKIVRYVLASGMLIDERPLSLIIIAPIECAKTALIRRYCLRNEKVLYLSDATAYGIIMETDELRAFSPGGYTHIAIPDFLACIGRKQSTVAMLITFFNSLLEEGVVNIASFVHHINRSAEVKAGLITAIPPDDFGDRRRRWERMGFLSRALPVTYDYKESTKVEVCAYIQRQKHLKEKTAKILLPEEPQLIRLPLNMARRIQPYAVSLAKDSRCKVYGFRYLKQLQTLAKAIALLKGKDTVDEECLDALIAASEFINYEFTKI